MSDQVLMVEDVAPMFGMAPQTLRNKQGLRAQRIYARSFPWGGARCWLQSDVDALFEEIRAEAAKFNAMRLLGLSSKTPHALAEYRHWEAEERGL